MKNTNKKVRGVIGRTITITHCTGKCVVDGEFVDYNETLIGDYNLQSATNTIRRRTKDNTIVITNIEKDVDYYSVPLDVFIETAIKYKE